MSGMEDWTSYIESPSLPSTRSLSLTVGSADSKSDRKYVVWIYAYLHTIGTRLRKFGELAKDTHQREHRLVFWKIRSVLRTDFVTMAGRLISE